MMFSPVYSVKVRGIRKVSGVCGPRAVWCSGHRAQSRKSPGTPNKWLAMDLGSCPFQHNSRRSPPMLGGKTEFLSQEMVWRGRKCCVWVSFGSAQTSLGVGCCTCTSEHPEQPQLLLDNGGAKGNQRENCHPVQAAPTVHVPLADGSPGSRRVTF